MAKKSDNKEKTNKTYFIIKTLVVFLLISWIASSIFNIFTSGEGSGNVAMIKIRGTITVDNMDSFSRSTTSSLDFIELIEEAEESPMIEAIVIDINSGGGSPVASKEIADAIERAEKPTVAVIHEVGASGAYWVASAADHIIANELSITGSIGVISSYLEFSGLIENYNMTYNRLVSGEHKDMGDPFKELTSEERGMIQEKIDKIHNYFIAVVSKNRNLSMEKTKDLATGEIFLGKEALEFGLVDQVGDLETSKSYLVDNFNITNVEFSEYSKQESFMELITGVVSGSSFSVGKGIGESLSSAGFQKMSIKT